MNKSIARLFVVVILLFGVLVFWTSRWTVFNATALQNNPRNRLSFYASLKIKRGRILAANGQLLAHSIPARGGTWDRKYPAASLFAQTIGYAFPSDQSFAGLEDHYSGQLAGTVKTGLSSVFGNISTPTRGDDLYTTLDPTSQRLAQQLLQTTMARSGATSGSVVALTPQTGAVKVLYSSPSYDDNNGTSNCTPPGCSLFTAALQGGFPPGSTFKVVTATAGLDTGKYTPESTIDGHSPLEVSGAPLQNDDGEQFGYVTLAYALTQSINTVFAQVGQTVGSAIMQDYMKRFGFYAKPPLDFPAGQMTASGEKINGKLVPVTNGNVDLGRTAIGQAGLLVTPMQMAMVASAIANGGKLMEPRLATKLVNSDGQVVENVSPKEFDQVMKPSTASELTSMMRNVVEEGTGTAANLEGVNVAGKTGTASTGGTKDGQPLDDAWFIGFGPVEDPKVAVAVELSNIPNGYGGIYAAPVAAQVIKTLLAEGQ